MSSSEARKFQRKSRTMSLRTIKRDIERNKLPLADHWRPTTRADCADVPRPCPYVACRYSLYLDVTPRGGIQLNFPDKEPGEMIESCALDAADTGGMTLNEVGARLDVTRERIRQIEAGVVPKFGCMLRSWHSDDDE